MAQSALTVTPPSPTPPTNFSCTGATPPNVPNYTKNTYNDSKNWGMGTVHPATPYSPTYPANPPPYFDDGSAGALTTLATATSALASGSGATAGGTEGTYPGAANGAVPASSSAAHEGAGTETVVTAPGSRAECPTQSVSVLGSYTSTPNGSHASNIGAAVTPTITGLSAGGTAGAGTTLLTVTGTNFNRASIVNIDGVPQTTNYVSATSLTVTNAPKKATAGNKAVTVTAGVGGVTTAPTNWVFT